MSRLDPSRALAIAAGLVIIALTGAAFWLSYAHLAEVALAHGLGAAKERAWAWPATLDLFIVAGELLMLRSALANRVDWWAITLTSVGSLGSIVLNVAGVTGDRDPSVVPLLDYVVAAVPPTAALLAFGALMRQVHQALAGHVAEETVTTDVTTVVTIHRADEELPPADEEPLAVAARPIIELPAAVPMWDSFSVSKVAAAVPAETPRQVVTEVVTRTPADLRRDATRLHRQVVRSGGRGVTIAQLQDELGLSRRDASALRRQVVTEVTA
ncbi:DUF2637 domain-containing protein [Streptomyces sp. S584]|uniref:DUF2637 domain-containing protein n=1 Tax=Streptomyces sp. S584 TaxID=3096010 RepID=UPI002AFFD7A1|nr:DUF2637 domain-containing protein [Streptomyces sp. S584]